MRGQGEAKPWSLISLVTLKKRCELISKSRLFYSERTIPIFFMYQFAFLAFLLFPSLVHSQGGATGRYINQNGNVLEIQASMIYYTGTWSGEKVTRKPFAFVPTSDGNFRMGGQRCSIKKNSITCIRDRDNVVLNYVPYVEANARPSIAPRSDDGSAFSKTSPPTSPVTRPMISPPVSAASPVDASDPLSVFDGAWVALNPPGPLVSFFKAGLGQRMASLAMGQASIRVSDGTSGSQLRVSGEGFNCYYAVSFVGSDEMVWQLKQGESVCFTSAHYKKSR